jgi:signal peptidase I
MSADDVMSRRGTLARIGICVLNWPANGLGLIRLGLLRRGFALMATQLAVGGAILATYFAVDSFTPWPWFSFFALAALATLAIFGVAIWHSWRASAFIAPSSSPWSRWYGVLGILLVSLGANVALAELVRSRFSAHHMVSAASAPTIIMGDRFLLARHQPEQLRRGAMMGITTDFGIYVFRLIGLPGDRVEMRDGRLLLNGVAARQVPVAEHLPAEYGSGRAADILTETLPGSGPSYRIADSGFTPGDNFGPVRVPAGHLFFLGDNRDNAADSRYEPSPMVPGLGIVPLDRVLGEVQFITYNPSDRTRFGRVIR